MHGLTNSQAGGVRGSQKVTEGGLAWMRNMEKKESVRRAVSQGMYVDGLATLDYRYAVPRVTEELSNDSK